VNIVSVLRAAKDDSYVAADLEVELFGLALDEHRPRIALELQLLLGLDVFVHRT